MRGSGIEDRQTRSDRPVPEAIAIRKALRWAGSFRRVSLDALRPGAGSADTIPPLPRWLITTFFLVTLLRISLVAAISVRGMPNAIYDDAMFIRLASSLSLGQWLGPYDQYTLAKGPMYPVFISLCHAFGLPLKLSELLLYAAFCLALVAALKPAVRNPWVLLALFAGLLFDPAWTSPEAHLFLRDQFSAALTGFIFAFAIGIVLRRHLPLSRSYTWAVGLGASLACFWLTREEAVWILPALVLLYCWAAWTVLRHHPRPLRWLTMSLVPLVIWGSAQGLVCLLNGNHYGIYATTEFKTREFQAAYGALSRIRPAEFQRGIPAPKEVRQRAYAVSPTFRQLQPYLEGQLGQAFAEYTADECPGADFHGEIGGGHFLWALRDAVARAGHARSGREAMQFYARMAEEINAACDRGQLAAGPRRVSMLPPWDSRYLPPFAAFLAAGVKTLLFWDDSGTPRNLSTDGEEALMPYREMTHTTLAPTEPPWLRLTGWAFSPTLLVDLRVLSAEGELLESTLTWQDSRALYLSLRSRGQEFRNALHAQFRLTFPRTENCKLAVYAGDKAILTIPLDGRRQHIDNSALHMQLDEVQPVVVEFTEAKGLRTGALGFLGVAYRFALPPLVFAALLGFLVQIAAGCFRKRFVAPVITGVLLVGVASRLSLMGLADAVAHPPATPGFGDIRLLLPAHVLLIAFCVLAVAEAVPLVIAWFRKAPAKMAQAKSGVSNV